MYEQKVEDCSHFNFADEVAIQILRQFSPNQQREILIRIGDQVKSDYEQKIQSSQKELHFFESAFKEFLG